MIIFAWRDEILWAGTLDHCPRKGEMVEIREALYRVVNVIHVPSNDRQRVIVEPNRVDV